MTTIKQSTFSGGLVGPQLLGRSDLAKYQTGCRTLRNFIVSQHTAANQLARLAHAPKLRNTISAGYAELKGNPKDKGAMRLLAALNKKRVTCFIHWVF